MLRHPPDILITTPESLFLLLTSRARAFLESVETVIVDEIHAVVGTKRGAHLALTLERLEEVARRPLQRIGLSATQRPLEEVARYLGGGEGLRTWKPRPVTIVDAGARKVFDLRVEVPVEDMARLGEAIEPSADEIPEGRPASRAPLDLARHPPAPARARAGAPLDDPLRELPPSRRAPGGRPQRAGGGGDRPRPPRLDRPRPAAPDRGRAQGRPPPRPRGHVVARAGHRHGRGGPRGPDRDPHLGRERDAADRAREPPGGRGLARHHLPEVPGRPPGERRDHEGDEGGRGRGDARPPEPARRPGAAPRGDGRPRRAEGGRALRPRPPRRTLLRPGAGAVRGRPRHALGPLPLGRVRGAAAARRVGPPPRGRQAARGHAAARRRRTPAPSPTAASTASSSPTATAAGKRVGELDEEMVFESRAGEVFVLGATSWRITEITRDRVLVLPAPGEPGKMPFWKADRGGRPVEMGRAIGRLTRELLATTRDEATERLQRDHDLDPLAAQNLLAYLEDQREATGVLPDDRTIVLERTRDEMGDWRLCLLSPWGGRVHAPWATALEARLRQAGEAEVESIWSDDGIVLRLPERERPPEAADLLPEPEEIEDLVVRELGGTSLFAARFREAAARALLLPRRRPGPADAALDAEEARPRPPAGGRALPVLPDRARGLPRVPARRVRPAGARGDRLPRPPPRDPPRHRGHAVALALLGVAALRLRRQLPLRGRRASRRAARAGPRRRPGPAARAPRRGGAAGADRPPGPRRAGGHAPVPRRRPPGHEPRAAPRPAAPPRRPLAGRSGGARPAAPRGRRRGGRGRLARRARAGAPRHPHPRRGRGALGRRRGRGAPARRARHRAAAGPPRRLPRAAAARAARGRLALRAHARALRRRSTSPGATRPARRPSSRPSPSS